MTTTDWQDERNAEHRAQNDAVWAGAGERTTHPERFDADGKRRATIADLIAEAVNSENAAVVEWEITSRGIDLPAEDAARRSLLIEVLIAEHNLTTSSER